MRAAGLRRPERVVETRVVRRGDLRDESGIALVLALAITMVLSVMLTSTIALTSAGERAAHRSNADQRAFALAEAGMNNALAVLGAAYAAEGVSYDTPGNLLPQRSSTYDRGTVTWDGEFCTGPVTARCKPTDDHVWRITSTARIANPTGPGAAPVARTVTVRAPVVAGGTKSASRIWSWVYSGGGPTAGLTTGSCDMTLQNQVRLLSPLYVVGNLCLENRSAIAQPPVPTVGDCPSASRTDCNRLVVGGWLWQRSTHTQVGTSASRLTEAHVTRGCAVNTGPSAVVTNPCLWDGAKVYVVTAGRYSSSSGVELDPPSFAWDDFYRIASPGPTHPCTTVFGTIPIFDTGDGARNNSVVPIVNLTPPARYTCRTDSGELSWDPATRTLTIAGTIFIDGSAEVDTSGTVRYVGQGFLWLSGTFLVKNAKLCATPTSDWSGCDFAAWDPNTTAMGVAANGSGGQVSSTTGVEVRSGVFQGLFYATRDIVVLTTGRMQGPMISLTKVVLSQTGDLSFPPISILPAGAPGELPRPGLATPDEFGG